MGESFQQVAMLVYRRVKCFTSRMPFQWNGLHLEKWPFWIWPMNFPPGVFVFKASNTHHYCTPCGSDPGDIGRILQVRSTLRQFVRDWAKEGQAERAASYSPLISALLKHLPPKGAGATVGGNSAKGEVVWLAEDEDCWRCIINICILYGKFHHFVT